MSRRTAVISFLGICVELAILLLTNIIPALAGGGIFAVALLGFGLASRGFKE